MLSLIKAEFQKRCFKLPILILWGITLWLSSTLVRVDIPQNMYSDVFYKFTGIAPFMGLIMFILFSGAYTQEYESGMNSLINSTKLGKKKIVAAKWIAHGLMASIINLSIFFTTFFQAYFAAKGKGLDLHLTKLWYFGNSGSKLTVLQLTLIFCVTLIIGSFFFAQIGLTLSAISKSAILPFLLGGFIMGIPTIGSVVLALFKIPIKTIYHLFGFAPLNVMYYGEQIRYAIPFISTIINIVLFIAIMIILPKIASKAFTNPNRK